MVAEEAAVNRGAVPRRRFSHGKYVRSIGWCCLAAAWKRGPGETAVEDGFCKVVVVWS